MKEWGAVVHVFSGASESGARPTTLCDFNISKSCNVASLIIVHFWITEVRRDIEI